MNTCKNFILLSFVIPLLLCSCEGAKHFYTSPEFPSETNATVSVPDSKPTPPPTPVPRIVQFRTSFPFQSLVTNGNYDSAQSPNYSKFGLRTDSKAVSFAQSEDGLPITFSLNKLDPGFADVLLVVDNSPTMLRIIPRIKASLAGLVAGLNTANYQGKQMQWRVAVSNTDLSDTRCVTSIINSTDAAPLNSLTSAVDFNATGSEDERPALKAANALNPSCGWRRPGAPLATIFFSDEDIRNPGQEYAGDALAYNAQVGAMLKYSQMIEAGFWWLPNQSATQCIDGTTQAQHFSAINAYMQKFSVCQNDYSIPLKNLGAQLVAKVAPYNVLANLGRAFSAFRSVTANGILSNQPALDFPDLIYSQNKIDLSNASSIVNGSRVDFTITVSNTIPRKTDFLLTLPIQSPFDPMQARFVLQTMAYGGASWSTVTPSRYEILSAEEKTNNGTRTLSFTLHLSDADVATSDPNDLSSPARTFLLTYLSTQPLTSLSFPTLVIPQGPSYQIACRLASYNETTDTWNSFQDLQYGTDFSYQRASSEIFFPNTVTAGARIQCQYAASNDPILEYPLQIPTDSLDSITVLDTDGLAVPFRYDTIKQVLIFNPTDVYPGRSVSVSYNYLSTD